jgi:hypothetical protein
MSDDCGLGVNVSLWKGYITAPFCRWFVCPGPVRNEPPKSV